MPGRWSGTDLHARAEQAGYQLELSTLMRSLRTTKLVSAGLIAVGFGGFLLFQ